MRLRSVSRSAWMPFSAWLLRRLMPAGSSPAGNATLLASSRSAVVVLTPVMVTASVSLESIFGVVPEVTGAPKAAFSQKPKASASSGTTSNGQIAKMPAGVDVSASFDAARPVITDTGTPAAAAVSTRSR